MERCQISSFVLLYSQFAAGSYEYIPAMTGDHVVGSLEAAGRTAHEKLGPAVKGTGTQDLIWLKVVSLDRSWLVGHTDDL